MTITRAAWAEEFLQYAGWDLSQEKVIALVAQMAKENSGESNTVPGGGAAFNPLDTEEPAPGATHYNAAGVKNYVSLDAGFGATLATFKNGYYPQLVAILADPAGGSALAYAGNTELNVWGTGNCTSQVEEIKAGDPKGYRMVVIAPGEDWTPPAPAPSPPAPKPRLKGPTMFITTQENEQWLVSGGVATHIVTVADSEALTAAGVITIDISAAQFAVLKQQS